MYIISKFNKSVNQKGSSLSLPAHGRAWARATPFLAALFAKQKTKFGGGTPVVERFAFTTGQEARAGKNFYPVGSRSDSFGAFPPTPFLFARPSENYQNSASGFSRKKVRILSKRDSTLLYSRFSAPFCASSLRGSALKWGKFPRHFSPVGRKKFNN